MSRHTDFIPFSRPRISHEEEAAVLRVLRSGWVTTGQECLGFERDLAEMVGVKHALAMNSGTACLHLGLEAMGIKKDDYVITTPYSFTASSEIIRYLGAHPYFVDIDKGNFHISSEGIDKCLHSEKKNFKAILPVHIAGESCDMSAILELAQKHGLKVLEDGAHSFPAKDKEGYFQGTRGDAGIYSFYANKTITTGEGGMLVTNDSTIAERVKIMRLHGIDRESWDRYTSTKPKWFYQVVEAGYKYNLSDILAAIGRVQLTKAMEFLEFRAAIARRYTEELKELDCLVLPAFSKYHSWHLFVVSIVSEKLTINRDRFIEVLAEKGIGTSVHFIPLHIMPYYQKTYGFKPEDFPHALDKYQRSFSLPIYPDLGINEQEKIIDAIKGICKNHYKKSLAVQKALQ
ncbi:MAG: DegT/DnrJ/EryC1/StrS family aminotransferase [Spirochaetales bacterium]|nr:DegT/DnrJ/EryC1/StrS family aminotransferase [Spirochaetales bacterium]